MMSPLLVDRVAACLPLHMDAYFPGTRIVQHISVCQVRVPVVYFWFLLGNEV